MTTTKLFFIGAEDLDLFVRSLDPAWAVRAWRMYFDLDDTHQPDAVWPVPPVEGKLGAVAWHEGDLKLAVTPALPMPFDRFQQTRERCKDIGLALDDEAMQGAAGFIYIGKLWIEAMPKDQEFDAQDYHLIIERSEWNTPDLRSLERRLYNYAVCAGLIKRRIADEMIAVAELTEEYRQWNERNGLKLGSAAEHLNDEFYPQLGNGTSEARGVQSWFTQGDRKVIIKTASWFAKLPADHLQVGISRGVPRGMRAGYKKFPLLNPGSWFNKVSIAEYLQLYNSILAGLDANEVAKSLTNLVPGKIPVLLCFEDPKKCATGEVWCHRHLAATWLEDKLGITVEEFGHPLLDRFAKLRREKVKLPSYR